MAMRQMSNLECTWMVRELAQLEGKHFSKIQQLGEAAFRLKIGDAHVVVELPLRISLAKYLPKAAEPAGFVQKAGKLLDNQKLARASQCGTDRIILLEFEKNTLILELFAKGNAIITDSAKKIVEVLREEKWKDRTLRKGETYTAPQGAPAENVKEALSEKYAIVGLLRLPLGKDYAKEMLERCGIEEKRAGNSLSEKETECLQSQYSEIVRNARPFLFLENGKPFDYGLAKLKKYALMEIREMPSLSEAMEEFYAVPHEASKSARLEKLERRLAEQLAALEKLSLEEKEAKEKGDYIYSNYNAAEQVLALAGKAGIQNVEAGLGAYKLLSVNRKRKEIELEL